MAGASLVPLHQKVQNHVVVRDGDALHVRPIYGDLQDLVHRAVDDRVQPPHIFVVGGLDDGHVELLVRQGPVSARLCDALHPLRFLADLRQFFVCGTLTGQRHGGGLKDQPHFKQVPGPDPGPQVGQRRQIHRAGGQILRDKRALAPADLQHALGHQKGDSLPERGAADVQRLTEFVFIRELAPRRELPFVHD